VRLAAAVRRTDDASVKRELLRGVAQIRSAHDRRRLEVELKATLARLRRTRGSTADGRRARGLAIDGLESTLRGVESLIAFEENDSGNIAAATRDAKRADRFLARGADQLRAAARALGTRLGDVNGY
jgi:hypothetical protein